MSYSGAATYLCISGMHGHSQLLQSFYYSRRCSVDSQPPPACLSQNRHRHPHAKKPVFNGRRPRIFPPSARAALSERGRSSDAGCARRTAWVNCAAFVVPNSSGVGPFDRVWRVWLPPYPYASCSRPTRSAGLLFYNDGNAEKYTGHRRLFFFGLRVGIIRSLVV